MKKKIIIAILICALIGGGIAAYWFLNTPEEIKTVSPQTGNLETTVEETGQVAFDDEYTVTAKVSAEVTSAEFEEGDFVNEGDVLYVLDDKDMKNQIEQTKISLEKAKEAYSQSVSAVNDLNLYAKAGGLITTVYVHEGDFVQPGTPVAELVESNYLKLTIPFSLPEEVSVYEGKNVKVIMAVDGSEVSGTVNKVYEANQSFEGGRRGKNIEVKIANPGALKAGDAAFAEIDGISSISSGTLANYLEQTLVASQSGEIEKLNIRVGRRLNVGELVLKAKNDSLTNGVTNASLLIKEIETSLSQQQEKLDDFVITSPISGVVIQKIAKKSDIIQGGAPLVVMADVTKLYVEADIDEIYINEISVGQKVIARAQNGERTQYNGTVHKVNREQGILKNGVTYYQIQIELETTDGLSEGMNMDVLVVTAESKETLYLPKEYVNGDKVTVLDGDNKKDVTVKTGIRTERYIEILEGLDKNDKIVVKGSAE